MKEQRITLYFLQKSSIEPTSDAWTCLKAALYCTSNLEQAPVYLKEGDIYKCKLIKSEQCDVNHKKRKYITYSLGVTQSLMYAFSKAWSVFTTANNSAMLSYL